MNFKYKLSRRLAISRILCALATSTIVACTVVDIADTTADLSKIVTLPTTVTLLPDESQLFLAYGITTAGDTTSVPVDWSASGGDISPDGTFTALDEQGDFTVVASAVDRPQVKGSSKVKVQAALSLLVITPRNVTLLEDEGQQFVVYGQRNGDSVAVDVDYVALGGGVTEAGYYTAGPVPGTYAVVATESLDASTKKGNRKPRADTAVVTIPRSNVLTSVILTPPSAQLAPGGTQQFDVYGRAADGDSVAVSVDYVATGGTITRNGFYTAGTVPGNFSMMAIESTGALADTSAISVNDPIPRLLQVILNPDSVALDTGSVQQFVALGRMSNGDTVEISAEYSTTGGTITADGYFTAGSIPGVFSIVATDTSGTLADTSAVVVDLAAAVLMEVILSPSSAALLTGESQQFLPRGRMSSGDTVAIIASYQATGGTITSDGLYTAGATAGDYIVIATDSAPLLTDTSTVTVTLVPVALVEVSPATAVLAEGQTQQLTAVIRDATGNELSGRVVTWSTSGGGVATVDDTGLVTALAEGSATVTATSEGQSGTAAISVTAAGGGPLPNECANPQPGWIWCDDFDLDRLGDYFEYDDSNGDFVRAASVGVDGSYGMRASFAASQVSAGSLHLAFGQTPQSYFRPVDDGTAKYREVYWRMYLRNQPGWVPGPNEKLSRATIFASPTSWAQAMIAHVWGGSGVNVDHLVTDPASGTDEQGNLQTTGYNDFANLRWLGAVPSATPLFDANHVGAWYCVEAHVRLNDTGQSNGVFELWIDGNLEAQNTGMNWVGAYNEYGINAVFFSNYSNGGSAQAQERYFDNIVVSTQPVGCGTVGTSPSPWRANEPGGYAAIVGRSFNSKAIDDSDRGTGAFPYKGDGSEGWDGIEFRAGRFTIIEDATAPVSPANVAQIEYSVGMNGGSAPATLQTQWFPTVHGVDYQELYVGYVFRISPGVIFESCGLEE